MFVDFRVKVPSTTALRVKTIEKPPATSSRKFAKGLCCFRDWMEFCISRFVSANVGQVWLIKTKIQHTDIFVVVKNQPSFALLLKSAQQLHCFISAKSLSLSSFVPASIFVAGIDDSQFQYGVALTALV